MWHDPQAESWINRLDQAIWPIRRPVILVAHSLGCHAVAGWARYYSGRRGRNVAGALLVAPPEVEGQGSDPRLARFAPVGGLRLPFPSILAASQDDPYIPFGRAKRLARIWGSRLVDAGPIGHINAESGIGDWNYGKYLLRHLISEIAPQRPPLLRGRAYEAMLASRPPQLALGR